MQLLFRHHYGECIELHILSSTRDSRPVRGVRGCGAFEAVEAGNIIGVLVWQMFAFISSAIFIMCTQGVFGAPSSSLPYYNDASVKLFDFDAPRRRLRR